MGSSPVRESLLWRSCKIAQCAVLLEGRLPDEQLSQLVFSGIFTNRIAPHLRAPRIHADEMALVEKFVNVLPERWLENGLPPPLAPIRDVLGPRAPKEAATAKTAKAAVRVLRRLRCHDEAQVLEATLR